MYTGVTGSNLHKEPKGQQSVEHAYPNDLEPLLISPLSLTANEKAEALKKKKALIEQYIKVIYTSNPFLLNVSPSALPVTLFLLKYLYY